MTYEIKDAKHVDAAGMVSLTVVEKDVNGDLVSETPMFIDTTPNDQTAVFTFAKQWLIDNPNVPVALPTATVSDKISTAKFMVINFADQITNKIYAKYARASASLWADFEREALAFNQDDIATNNPADFPNLLASVEVRLGSPAADDAGALARLAQSVPVIIANADRFRKIALYVDGLVSRVKSKLNTARTQDEIDAVMLAAKTEAETVATQYGLI